MLGCVAHFEIVRKIGEGGMGVVYQARDRTLSRFVALKFLNGELARLRSGIARFEREARAISALNHPNIATIHGIETTDDQRFLVLEYLPGGTLAARLERLRALHSGLAVEQALDYATQIAEGLKHAHEHGVVHRDIKASNIMFTEDGRIKITDFGIAQLNETLHAEGIVGSPPSMSPEQALGRLVDQRTDIFSWGVLLYELLSGMRPFGAPKGLELTHQIVCEEPAPLDSVRPGIPGEVQRIVAKALQKDPSDRYQSAAELLADLKRVRHIETSDHFPATSDATITLAPRGFRRFRKRVLALAGTAMLGAATFAITPIRQGALERLHLLPLPREKRVAVLPFLADSATQALSDGLNDIVSHKLGQLEQFHGSLLIVSPADINSKGVRTAGAARQNFGVNLAIMGSVSRRDDRVVALVSLVDTARLVELRSAAVESRFVEMTAFRDRVISKIAGMLDLELTNAAQRTLNAGETSVATAYADYIEGRGYLLRHDRAGNVDKATALFHSSLAKDPKFALAWAGLAEAGLRRYNDTKDPKNINEADANGERAIQLNSELEPVHVTMGLIHSAQGDFEGAEAEFRRVLTLDPLNFEAHRGLAQTFSSRSRMKDAEQAYKKAIELRQNDWASYNLLGAFYFNQSCYAQAEPYFRKVEQLTQDNYLAYTNLGATYLKLGDTARAITMFHRSLELNSGVPLTYSNLGMAHVLELRFPEAAEWHRKATQLAPGNERYWGNLAHALRWAPALADQAPDAYRHAIELGEREITVNPREPNIHARLAEYWAALKDSKNSRMEIGRALALAPASPYVQFRAALVYEQFGERKRAIKALQAAMAGGYSLGEIAKAPPLKNLFEDPAYQKLVNTFNRKENTPCSLKRN